MPFTPYHLGFAILLFAIINKLDPISITLGCILIDLEGILYILCNIGELHGKFHSLLGVLILIFPIVMLSFIYNKLGGQYPLNYSFSWFSAMVSAFIGLLSHIFFDAIIYPEMMFFYPFSSKNGFFYGLWDITTAYTILSVMLVIGLILFTTKLLYINKKNHNLKNQEREKI